MSSHDANKWLDTVQNIESRRKKMHEFLHHPNVPAVIRERLNDQLSWLKHQIQSYKLSTKVSQKDVDNLKDRFEWVVENFNDDLNLGDHERMGTQLD